MGNKPIASETVPPPPPTHETQGEGEDEQPTSFLTRLMNPQWSLGLFGRRAAALSAMAQKKPTLITQAKRDAFEAELGFHVAELQALLQRHQLKAAGYKRRGRDAVKGKNFGVAQQMHAIVQLLDKQCTHTATVITHFEQFILTLETSNMIVLTVKTMQSMDRMVSEQLGILGKPEDLTRVMEDYEHNMTQMEERREALSETMEMDSNMPFAVNEADLEEFFGSDYEEEEEDTARVPIPVQGNDEDPSNPSPMVTVHLTPPSTPANRKANPTITRVLGGDALMQ